MLIRAEQLADLAAIRRVNEEAFGRAAEADLVDRLRANHKAILSLVAEDNGVIVGHILFSEVTVEVNPPSFNRFGKLIGLAPMAVTTARQRSGIGSQLVRAGLAELKGYEAAVVLGHPEYYPRFGFVPASRFGLKSEYDVRDEVFMALELTPNALAQCSGVILYQAEFNEL